MREILRGNLFRHTVADGLRPHCQNLTCAHVTLSPEAVSQVPGRWSQRTRLARTLAPPCEVSFQRPAYGTGLITLRLVQAEVAFPLAGRKGDLPASIVGRPGFDGALPVRQAQARRGFGEGSRRRERARNGDSGGGGARH